MSDEKFLLVKGTQGMGNRMLALAGAILYAKLSGRRLVVDWKDGVYAAEGRNAFDDFFARPTCNPPAAVPVTDEVVPSFWRGRLHGHVDDVLRDTSTRRFDPVLEARSRLDLSRLDHPERVAVFWGFTARLAEMRPHLRGRLPELAPPSDDDILRPILREELQLTTAMRARVSAFRDRCFHRPTIGVQVRYGDHRVALRPILGRVAMLVRQDPTSQIFLATDNPEVLRTFQRLYPGVVATPHRYPRPGVPLHFDPSCTDRVAGGVEALLDMYLLAECDALVVDTSSSFARVASLLSGLGPSSLHDVTRRQYKPSRRRRRIVYRVWRRTGLFTRMPRLLGRLAALTWSR